MRCHDEACVGANLAPAAWCGLLITARPAPFPAPTARVGPAAVGPMERPLRDRARGKKTKLSRDNWPGFLVPRDTGVELAGGHASPPMPFLSQGRGLVAETEDPWISALAAALVTWLGGQGKSGWNTMEMKRVCPRGAERQERTPLREAEGSPFPPRSSSSPLSPPASCARGSLLSRWLKKSNANSAGFECSGRPPFV